MNRPKTLSFTNDENEYEDEPNDMMNEIHEDHQSNGLFSPALSDSSISSVNVRQRKLSETVVDWVFDETSVVSSQSSSLNNIIQNCHCQNHSSSTSGIESTPNFAMSI